MDAKTPFVACDDGKHGLLERPCVHQRLFLIRHGQTDWNAIKRLQGRCDIPLNDTGQGQALRHGARLAEMGTVLGEDFSKWYFVASPMKRTCETMEIVREALGLPRENYDVAEQLLELGYGAWEGRSWDELRTENPVLIEQRFANPWDTVAPGGGEHHEEMQARVLAWYQALPKKTIAVSHSGPMRIVRGAVTGMTNDEIAVQVTHQDQFLDVRPDGFVWV